jgi:plasmid stabilization system protein ParE
MSTSRVRYHQGAVGDVKSVTTWYLGRSPKAALDFVEELERAVHTIREAPERWQLGREQYETLPSLAISIFCYLLRTGRRNRRLAVAHSSRRPEYWARRLK